MLYCTLHIARYMCIRESYNTCTNPWTALTSYCCSDGSHVTIATRRRRRGLIQYCQGRPRGTPGVLCHACSAGSRKIPYGSVVPYAGIRASNPAHSPYVSVLFGMPSKTASAWSVQAPPNESRRTLRVRAWKLKLRYRSATIFCFKESLKKWQLYDQLCPSQGHVCFALSESDEWQRPLQNIMLMPVAFHWRLDHLARYGGALAKQFVENLWVCEAENLCMLHYFDW